MPSILHLLTRALATQKSVFAHVVVGNTAAHTIDTWTQDINLAAKAGIDAFVLNMGYPDPNIPTQVANAFAAAESANVDFKLFFAFDYLGGGQPWPANGQNSVSGYLNKYKNSKSYFNYQGKPMASTFEGVDNVDDWAYGGPIRSAVGDIYFVPDWSSLGPAGIKAHLDKIEGAFSWDMWPTGPNNVTVGSDKAWQEALGSKSYMMGVSPWFFRSASGGKQWIWKGDDLWADRWNQTLDVEPEFVQIVTWNDYGESHYIGPIHDSSEIPPGSETYVKDMPHEQWTNFLPYYIAKFKDAKFNLTDDKMQYWYRDAPAAAGRAGTVVGNNVQHGQVETSPVSICQDKIYFSALLKASATVQVQIGGNAPQSYKGKKGYNHWSQDFAGQTGVPTFTIFRKNKVVKTKKGRTIGASTALANGLTNFNAWVGGF